mmetsp:Transcript_873/g.748  ORF Transcript_873/g.748 Transcript_873/m.748 type:complete len:120 (-) Transcript_873:466-825(-)
MYDSTATSARSNSSWSAYSSELSEESSESDEEYETPEEIDYSIGRTTNSISITDKELFEENDEEYKYDPTCHPLDQGLLFKLLYKRFRDNFIPQYKNKVNTVDNLLMTSIFSKLASIPL